MRRIYNHVCKKSLATKATDTDYREVSGHSLTKTISEQIYFKKIYDEIFHFCPTNMIKFQDRQDK